MTMPITSLLSGPTFLMNPPLTLETSIPNNRTMTLLSEDARRIDADRAMEQWMGLYRQLSQEALVYLLPNHKPLQDICFVSNLGVVLNHLENPIAVISNFKGAERQGESEVGRTFFRELGYEVTTPPHVFEGEAELKHLSGAVYIGGYGLRTAREAHSWLDENYHTEIISLKLEDPHLYHLDCVLQVLNEETLLLCTEVCEAPVLRKIEQHCSVIDVPLELAYRGATNNIRCGSTIMAESQAHVLNRNDANYLVEIRKREFLQSVAESYKLEMSFFNLDEFHKSGAMLSCLIMPICNGHAAKTGE
jgi:N-dimethylarginine dimethylaminohydrolase